MSFNLSEKLRDRKFLLAAFLVVLFVIVFFVRVVPLFTKKAAPSAQEAVLSQKAPSPVTASGADAQTPSAQTPAAANSSEVKTYSGEVIIPKVDFNGHSPFKEGSGAEVNPQSPGATGSLPPVGSSDIAALERLIEGKPAKVSPKPVSPSIRVSGLVEKEDGELGAILALGDDDSASVLVGEDAFGYHVREISRDKVVLVDKKGNLVVVRMEA